MSRPFIDLVEIQAEAGTGGDGCTSFQRGPNDPRGGPDGGNGGPGGDVVIEAQSRISTLMDLNYEDRVRAENGGDGGPNNRKGGRGADQNVPVPEGTIIYDRDTGETLAELLEEGESMVVAEGGSGGRGNQCFANSQRQAPHFHEYGAKGETRNLRLELKLLADVGLVGKPNAGKSTLLDRLTRAHPRVADYPFTTVSPNLGVLFRDYEKITLCDIPGLIENAHDGAGLGFDFLRHADRTKILMHVVDLAAERPVQNYNVIRHELKSYDESMLNKPTLVVLNKVDLVDEDMVELFHESVEISDPVVTVSALEEINLEELEEKLWDLYDKCPEEPEDQDEGPDRVVKMEQVTPISVTKKQGYYHLKGDRVHELVNRFNLANPEALAYVRDQLLQMNLHKKLEREGCRPGDTVRLGNQEFEYTG